MVALLVGCASMDLGNYGFVGEQVVFDTDFAEMPGSVKDWEDNPLVQHDAENEYVHVRAEEGDGTSFFVNEPVSRFSRVTFQLKLGEEINPDHPQSHINLLVNFGEEYERLCINFDADWGIGYFWNASGSRGDGRISEMNLVRDRWYLIDILLNDERGIVFIDSKRVGFFTVSDELPADGILVVESHNELWIDDIRIARFDSYAVE